MGQALYRKYRSKSLNEIVGQEHITDTLAQALKQGKISHAYLFTGPRGVGKTSIARILAHEINGLPYTDDSSHIDIIEIDAASNRRIDEIRELRDKIYIAPTSVKYKVYIIDEVHMLTKEAFNALLKTLEEPPEHAVFMLATTDAHKLPDTIVSRTQRYTFKPVPADKVAVHLSDIAKKEKIKITPDALQLLAEHGEGSFRDSISLLDQLSSHGKSIDTGEVQKLLGVPSKESVNGILQNLGDTGALMTALHDLFTQGFQAAAIAKQLGQILRSQLVEGKTTLSSEATLELLKELIKVPVSHDPERFLEITLLNVRPPRTERLVPDGATVKTVEAKVEMPVKKEAVTEAKENVDEPQQVPEPGRTAPPPKAKTDGSKKKNRAFDESLWADFLTALKRHNYNTLYGVVRMAKPSFGEDGTLQLAFAFSLHEKRIREASNMKKLTDVLLELTGEPVRIEPVFDASVKAPKVSLEVPAEPKQDSKDDLTAISNIFGKAELLES
jgi:DNA polymerase III subunit gamma/tau